MKGQKEMLKGIRENKEEIFGEREEMGRGKETNEEEDRENGEGIRRADEGRDGKRGVNEKRGRG